MPPLAPFKPRLLRDMRGYNRERLVRDVGAGATVGIVALPLAMAFAIASGLKPEAGLWTAIIAGFIISALGGTSVQIGGPAGAFIVIVYGIVERYGVANLLIATASAGVLLFLLGLFRLGTLVRYVPVSVVIGFTNGIAVLIALSQVRDLLGLDIAKMPADFFAQISALASHLHSINLYALGLGLVCVAGLFLAAAVGSGLAVSPPAGTGGHRERAQGHFPPARAGGGADHALAAGLVSEHAGGNHRQPVWRHPADHPHIPAARLFLGNGQDAGHAHAHHRDAGRH